jgi:heme/copper-type cytochrome/quinol oxidase subunit 3
LCTCVFNVVLLCGLSVVSVFVSFVALFLFGCAQGLYKNNKETLTKKGVLLVACYWHYFIQVCA